MEVTRLFDIPEYALSKFSKRVALASKQAGKWITYNSSDFKMNCDKVSLALLAAGVKPGDKIANISSNRPEWNFTDIGIMQTGAIHVPIYPVISNRDLIFILNETNARIVFAGNNYAYNKLLGIRDHVKRLEKIIVFDPLPGAEFFGDFLKSPEKESYTERLEQIKTSTQPDDLATIIYTSGTLANPKGVMLSHTNIVSNFKALSSRLKIDPSNAVVSYLPLCHIFERMMNYMFMYCGLSVFYAESISGITDNIREVQPQIITSVPLLLEKIYQGILNKRDFLTGFRKRIFSRAFKVAVRFPLSAKPGIIYSLQRSLYNQLVYKKWREALGGKLTRIYCGGAALQPSILRFFWAAGIRVYEGYGLTETSPVIASNTDFEFRLGTVGSKIDGVDVMIAEDGEILTKGPCVMLGYYMDPQTTFETLDEDGWFHTGDIGEIVEGKYLRLTGRKKVLFKTTSGEYVIPEGIENQLKQSPFINQAMVVGANQSYLGALIVPDFNYILSWFDKQNLPFGDDASLASHTLVVREIEKAIWDYNKNVFETERIERFRILSEEWTVEKGELTPKMSLKRNFIGQKYKKIISSFFE